MRLREGAEEHRPGVLLAEETKVTRSDKDGRSRGERGLSNPFLNGFQKACQWEVGVCDKCDRHGWMAGWDAFDSAYFLSWRAEGGREVPVVHDGRHC